MRTEAKEIVMQLQRRKSSGSPFNATPVLPEPNLQIVDAAFADLETLTLRRDNPSGALAEHNLSMPHDGIVQEFARQLQALEKQHRHLTQLLNELQSPDPVAV